MNRVETVGDDPRMDGLGGNPGLFEPLNFDALPLQEWPKQWAPTSEFPTPQSVGADEFSQVANSAYSFNSEPTHYRTGDPELPVAPYRDHFLQMKRDNQTLVVSSETGSGKSSQLPLYLLEDGAPRVFVTQPRIIATRELADRARQSLGPDYAHLVGHLNGNDAESDCGPDARIIYVTEQLLFNMANRGQLNPDDVIMIDEAHERTAATILLMGLLKEQQIDNPDRRTIISSATIDTGLFANYYTNSVTKLAAPVLELPGRTYPITDKETGESVAKAMHQLMQQGKRVLGFEPGIARLKKTASQAQGRKKGHKVHHLYGDQSATEQRAALTSEPNNHIVATRVGETSITPQGKDAVVDSGLSNIGLYRKGVRVLRTDFSSQATMHQRRGRVGRTKLGLYVRAIPADAPPPPEFDQRPEYDPPAIQNSPLGTYIIELLTQGRRIEDLSLLEQPNPENLQHDHLVLRRLGATALDGGDVTLTPVGESMTRLPLDVSLARMLVEAQNMELGEGQDRTALLLQIAAAAAVRQVNGMLDFSTRSRRRYIRNVPNGEVLSTEALSDVLFELDIFVSMFTKQQQAIAAGLPSDNFDKVLTSYDILPNRYYKTVRTFEELCRRMSITPDSLQKPDAVQRTQIIDCQIVGTEELFVQQKRRAHYDVRGEGRTLGRRSNISTSLAKIVMGTAFDYEGLSASGRNIRRFVSGASAVTLEQLRDKAPHRISERSSGFVASKKGELVEKKTFYFDSELQLGDAQDSLPPTLEARAALIGALMRGVAPSSRSAEETVIYRPENTPNAAEAVKQWRAAQRLEQQTPVKLNTAKQYERFIKKIVDRSVDLVPLDVVDPAELDKLIPRVYVKSLVRPTRRKDVPRIIQTSPDAIVLEGGEDVEKQYVRVNYRNNIAYVTVVRDQLPRISRDTFAELLQHHDIKLRVGSGRYQQLDAAFTSIDALLKAQAEKNDRRRKKRAAAAENSISGEPSTSRRRAPKDLVAEAARVQAIVTRQLQRRKKRNERRAAQRLGADKD